MAQETVSLTAEECHERAGACAANARLAMSQGVALEFLKMAAQWRAMAERSIFLGSVAVARGPAAIIGPKLRLV